MKKSLPFILQYPFFKLLIEYSSIDEFEHWLYQDMDLDKYLNPDDYLALISMDFKDKYSYFAIKNIIQPYLNYADYYTMDLKNTLSALMDAPNDIKNLIKIYDYYCQGYWFLRKLALKYGVFAEDCVVGNPDTEFVFSNEDLNTIIEQATWLFDDLNQGKIVLLKLSGDHADIKFDDCYHDYRSDDEKARTDC